MMLPPATSVQEKRCCSPSTLNYRPDKNQRVVVATIESSTNIMSPGLQGEEAAVVSCNDSSSSGSISDTLSITSSTSTVSFSSAASSSDHKHKKAKTFIGTKSSNTSNFVTEGINAAVYESFLNSCRPLYFPDCVAFPTTSAAGVSKPLKLSPRLEDGLEEMKSRQIMEGSYINKFAGNKRGRDDQQQQEQEEELEGEQAPQTVICSSSDGLTTRRNTSAVSLDQALIEQ